MMTLLASPTATIAAEEPLVLGRTVIPTRYFLAPLAGYTQLPFRRVLRSLGGLGLATTDLVQATRLVAEHPQTLALLATTADDRPLSIQISSGRTEQLIAAARWLEDHGYEGVDLNLGCPMAKVNGQGGGARWLCDVDHAARMVEAVVASVALRVTVKMRLGWDARSLTAPKLARRCEEAGVAAITVHGRTRQQGFHGRVNLEGIAATVAAVRHIPVIGNGDVRTVDDALSMRKTTGCAAVAIGRGALLDPWIFRKLADWHAGSVPREPTREEQIDFLVRHFRAMLEQHGERGPILFRKFAAWYGATLGIPEDLEQRLRTCGSLVEFEDIVAAIRLRQGERRSRLPTALCKVPNGPVEYW